MIGRARRSCPFRSRHDEVKKSEPKNREEQHMTNGFISIQPEEIKDNTFHLIGQEWMLITAGTPESFNMMTASWGGFGILWHRKICVCFVRPERHTREFIEKERYFTLSFFSEQYRDMLNYCGTKSGKDVDKSKETGLTPCSSEKGSIYFAEARLVIECEKLYYQDINPAHFLNESINENYPQKDYHRIYIGEVTQCLQKK